MANAFYTPSGTPGTGSAGQSSAMRSEFALVQAAFDKMPALAGNNLFAVRVNSGATALEAISVTGTGSAVFSVSPQLTTPNIGAATGTSLSVTGQLTSTVATGTAPLVVSSTTQVANLYSARAALADTATTNANLTGPITSTGNATAVAAQTGTGSTFVMQTSPALTTPNIGVATATTVNKLTFTTPATGSTLTIADGKTLTANSSLTFTGTDGTTMTFPSTSATLARTDATNTFTGAQNISNLIATGGSIDNTPIGNNTRAAGNFTRVTEDLNTLTPASNAGVTVDWNFGGTKITTSGTNAITFANIPTKMSGTTVDVSTFNSVTWPAAVDWGVSGLPSIAGRAVVSLATDDTGTKVFASIYWRAV